MNETILKIRTIFNSKGVDDAKSGMRSVRDATKEAATSAKHANTVFSNFFSSLTRIAKLRLLRGIIRAITGAFKEGTENIYRYSQALQNADASHFASTMDALASSFLYLKNSIGAMVAPLLTSLLPAIQTVINWFVTAINVIAQFFAALGGQVMYTKAKEYATAWKDVETATGGAAAAAKEYQNTILSFDEIHALNDTPQGGGGGGGGGKVTPDYSDMFEEALINEKIKKLGEWLRKNFEGILDIVKEIALVLLTWKIASGVVNFFKGLGLLSGDMATGIKTIALGIILTVAGIKLAYEGGYDIGYDGANFMDIVKTALGNAMAGVGGALISVALGGAAGAGFIVTFGISLIATIIGFQIGKDEAMLDSTYRLTDSYQDYLTVTDMLTQVLERYNTASYTAEQIMSQYNDTVAKVRLAEYLVPQIEELSNKTERSAFENEKLQSLIDQLNGLGLEGIRAEYDENTGIIEFNTQAVWDNLEAVKESAKQTAYLDVLKAAWKDEAQAVIDAQIATDAYEYAGEQLGGAIQELQDYEREFGGTLEYDIDTVKQMEEKISDWADAQALAKESVEKTNERVKEATSYAERASDAYDEVIGATKDLSNTDADFSDIENGFDDVTKSAGDAYWVIKNISDLLGGMGNKVVDIAVNAIPKANGGFVMANGGIIPRFDGGGINTAQLFIANENGSSELIGNIGNRTAVANQGQMVEAMAQGVYMAMSDVMSSSNNNTEVNVYMNDEVVARAADRGQRSLNRRFNVSLA